MSAASGWLRAVSPEDSQVELVFMLAAPAQLFVNVGAKKARLCMVKDSVSGWETTSTAYIITTSSSS